MNEVHYLGVLITADLMWPAHIQTIVKNCSIEDLLNLYKSLICPMLEYCCLIWDPSPKTLIELLESTQKHAAKTCLGDWKSSYTHLLEKLTLPTHQSWRSYIKLCMVYKILNEESYIFSSWLIHISKLYCQ